jgi:hypothetical protein
MGQNRRWVLGAKAMSQLKNRGAIYLNQSLIYITHTHFPSTLITDYYFLLFNSVSKNNFLGRKKHWGHLLPSFHPPPTLRL